jgi:hypothetical protein
MANETSTPASVKPTTPAPVYNPISGNPFVNVGTSSTGATTYTPVTYTPAPAKATSFVGPIPTGATRTSTGYTTSSGTTVYALPASTKLGAPSTYTPSTIASSQQFINKPAPAPTGPKINQAAIIASQKQQLPTAQQASQAAARAGGNYTYTGPTAAPAPKTKGILSGANAVDLLTGSSSWQAAAKDIGAAVTGKSPTGQKLSASQRLGEFGRAAGSAGMGALALGSTASMLVPGVGEVAKAGYIGLKGAAGAVKAGADIAKASAAAKTSEAVSKVAPQFAATKEATAITKAAAKAPSDVVKEATNITKQSAASSPVVKQAEKITKQAAKQGPEDLGGSFGGGGSRPRPITPKTPSGGEGTAAAGGTTISEAPSSVSTIARESVPSSTTSTSQQFKNQFAPQAQAKFAKPTTDLPGAPGYTKTPPAKTSTSLPGAPGYTKTPGVQIPKTAGYPNSLPRSTTIGDRVSTGEKTFTPTAAPAKTITKVGTQASRLGIAATGLAASAAGKLGPTVKTRISDFATGASQSPSASTITPVKTKEPVTTKQKQKTVSPSIPEISTVKPTPETLTSKSTKPVAKEQNKPSTKGKTELGLSTLGLPTTPEKAPIEEPKTTPKTSFEPSPKPEPETKQPKNTETKTQIKTRRPKMRVRGKIKPATTFRPSSIV